MTETKMQLVDWLDDLCVRFIINLPGEELDSVERICFQIEEAQWFYEDFVRPLDPTLPSLSLRQFCLLMFQHCPIFAHFSEYHHMTAFEEFLAYKTRVPVRGAIMLNDAMDHVLMVRGWKSSATWSFPRGKINQNEKDIDCAVREAYEETGFDLRAAGLVEDESKAKHIEVTLREQHMMLFVFRGVPMDAVFVPQTRKEIGKIKWYKLTDLPSFKKRAKQGQVDKGDDVLAPNKFYMVAPFLGPLKKWIAYQRKMDQKQNTHLQPGSTLEEDPITADDTDNYLQQHQDAHHRPSAQEPHSVLHNASGIPTAAYPLRDVASDLKRMLSVGKRPETLQGANLVDNHIDHNGYFPRVQHASEQQHARSIDLPQADVHSGDRLLELLRQGDLQNSQDPNWNSIPAHTPFSQISFNPLMPPNSFHQQTRPSMSLNTVPTPPFPIPQASASRPQGSNFDPIQEPNGFDAPQNRQQILPLSVHATAPNSELQAVIPTFSETPLRPRGSYHRDGDTRRQEFLNDPGQNIQKSNVSGPKLSSHALNMLSLFKSKEKDGPAEKSAMSPPKVKLIQQADQEDEHFHDKHQFHPLNNQGRGQPGILRQHIGPSNSSRDLTETNSGNLQVNTQPSLTSSTSTTNKISQQSTLLNLFLTPSVRRDSQTRGPIQEIPHNPVPVELAAASTPDLRESQKKSSKDDQDKIELLQENRLAARPTVDTSQLSKPSEIPATVSATVSGPLPDPDFRIMRRSQVKRSNRSDAPTEQPRSNPIQILKRPSSSSGPNASASSISSSPNPTKTALETDPTLPKPFQPTILRRPQPSEKAALQEQSKIETGSGQPTRAADQHKETLLSLFNKSSISSVDKESASPIVSPLSIQSPTMRSNQNLPSIIHPNVMSPLNFGPDDPSRSRVSSLASVAEAQKSSSTSSPISPLDKSFLLGYLNNVVKNSGR